MRYILLTMVAIGLLAYAIYNSGCKGGELSYYIGPMKMAGCR